MVERTHITCPNLKNSSNSHLENPTEHSILGHDAFRILLLAELDSANVWAIRYLVLECFPWKKNERNNINHPDTQVYEAWAGPSAVLSQVCPEVVFAHVNFHAWAWRKHMCVSLILFGKNHLKILHFWMRGQSLSPNALVDRSKLKLEGKKNLSKYLLKTGKERL